MNEEKWDQDKFTKENKERDHAVISKYLLKIGKEMHKGYCECEKCKELSIIVSALYYRMEWAKGILGEISLRKGGIKFSSRGFGKEWVSCFICKKGKLNDNVSGFVKSKSDGEKIKKMFKKHISLDYRPSEPNYIQVKIGACEKHLEKLRKLVKHTHRSGTIEQWMVDEVYQ